MSAPLAARLLLVRQAGTDWSAKGRIEGRTGLPAEKRELERLRVLAAALKAFAPLEVYAPPDEPGRSSGLVLAEALGTPLWASEALLTLDMGAWAGLTWTEAKQKFGRAFRLWHAAPEDHAPPDGESLAEVVGRLRPLLERLRAAQQSMVLVGSRETLVAARLALGAVRSAAEAHGSYPWALFGADCEWLALDPLSGAESNGKD